MTCTCKRKYGHKIKMNNEKHESWYGCCLPNSSCCGATVQKSREMDAHERKLQRLHPNHGERFSTLFQSTSRVLPNPLARPVFANTATDAWLLLRCLNRLHEKWLSLESISTKWVNMAINCYVFAWWQYEVLRRETLSSTAIWKPNVFKKGIIVNGSCWGV